MKKATRRKNLRKKKTRSLKGGMIRGLTALAAATLSGQNSYGSALTRPTSYSSGLSTLSAYPSYPLLQEKSKNTWKLSELSPMVNAKDINGNPVSQEEAVKRIADWHSQVEEEQKDHAANPDNICSVQGGASSMCSGSIGIPRSLMPQIKRVNRQAFFDFLKTWTGNENLVHDEELDIESLTPTQSELMQPLIQKQINRATKNGTTPPTVIVTRDPTTGAYTLYDGHHRWAAMYQQYLASGTGGKIKTTVIDLPIMYTLELSAAFGAPHALTDV
jgi:hypothetical protein